MTHHYPSGGASVLYTVKHMTDYNYTSSQMLTLIWAVSDTVSVQIHCKMKVLMHCCYGYLVIYVLSGL